MQIQVSCPEECHTILFLFFLDKIYKTRVILRMFTKQIIIFIKAYIASLIALWWDNRLTFHLQDYKAELVWPSNCTVITTLVGLLVDDVFWYILYVLLDGNKAILIK